MGIGSAIGTYGNFILGNGSQTIGNSIKTVVKHRGSLGMGYGKAVTTGFARGVKKSYAAQVRSGGYFKSLGKAFSNIIPAFKSGKGLGKLSGLGKALGKTMPALFAALLVVPEIPNIVKATKEQGIGQGLKEVGKSTAKLTGGAIGAAIGSLIPIPFVGSAIGYMAGSAIAGKLVGKSYSEKQAERQANGQAIDNNQMTNNNIKTDNSTGIRQYIPDDSPMQLPPVDANDFDYRFPQAQAQFKPYSVPGMGGGQNNTMLGAGSKLNILSQ